MTKRQAVLLPVLRGARDLLFPPYCVICDKFLPYNSKTVFCPACQEAWDDARAVAAERVAASAAAGHAYAVLYRSGKTDGVPERFVFHLKHTEDTRAFAFAAQALAVGVRVALLSADASKSDTRPPLFTYAPRSCRALRRDEFDQAACLSRALARALGGQFASLFLRDEETALEQKFLGAEARRRNAAASFILSRRAERLVIGRTVVICDDLATTGATLNRCRKLLMWAGAAAVVFATVAQTGEW